MVHCINSCNPWTGNVFPFICVFFNFFHQCLQPSVFDSFSSLIKLTSWCFILWDSIQANFSPFLDGSLLVREMHVVCKQASVLILSFRFGSLVLTFLNCSGWGFKAYAVEKLWTQASLSLTSSHSWHQRKRLPLFSIEHNVNSSLLLHSPYDVDTHSFCAESVGGFCHTETVSLIRHSSASMETILWVCFFIALSCLPHSQVCVRWASRLPRLTPPARGVTLRRTAALASPVLGWDLRSWAPQRCCTAAPSWRSFTWPSKTQCTVLHCNPRLEVLPPLHCCWRTWEVMG